MKQEELLKGFSQLGALMRSLGKNESWTSFELGVTEEEFDQLIYLINRQVSHNGWFTAENVRKSMLSLGEMLYEDKLKAWSSEYSFTTDPKRVGLIMAGNIPMVGFHDFLCVLISGNIAVCKLSSTDKLLIPALSSILIKFLPELSERIVFVEGKIGKLDAVIATGSNNSLKYFEQYFGQYPHIFRKNRTSIGVLDGSETAEEIEQLGDDIFSYFGLGCRNVSHVMIPHDFELNRFFEGIFVHSEVVNNNKYGNNYDYNKAVYLMNQLPLLDNNFVLLRETPELFSPLAMIHYQRYNSINEVEEYLKMHEENLQVTVGKKYTPFGIAQKPSLTDYADGIDVMKWLSKL